MLFYTLAQQQVFHKIPLFTNAKQQPINQTNNPQKKFKKLRLTTNLWFKQGNFALRKRNTYIMFSK